MLLLWAGAEVEMASRRCRARWSAMVTALSVGDHPHRPEAQALARRGGRRHPFLLVPPSSSAVREPVCRVGRVGVQVNASPSLSARTGPDKSRCSALNQASLVRDLLPVLLVPPPALETAEYETRRQTTPPLPLHPC